MKKELMDLLEDYKKTMQTLRALELESRRDGNTENVKVLESKQDMAYDMAKMLFETMKSLSLFERDVEFDHYLVKIN